MLLNSNDIFSRLLELYETQKMNELSTLLGYKESWGAATRKRGGIPYEACVNAAEKFNVSMDFLLFGNDEEELSLGKNVNKLKQSITDGVFKAIQKGVITPAEEVSISEITQTILNEMDLNVFMDIMIMKRK